MDKDVFKTIWQGAQLPDPSEVDISGIVEDLWDAYVDSSSGMLNELEAAAMDMEAGRNVEDNAAYIRRLLHSLKGEAGMTGFLDVHNLCHETETAFEQLFQQGTAADMVLRVKDWISEAINYACGIDIPAYKKSIDRHQQKQQKDKGKIRTLCIDDNPICSRRIGMLIQDYCNCDFAVNGREGVDMYAKSLEQGNAYQLITLDIQMPEMDGHSTLKAIRQLEESRGIYGLDGVKIIMSTSQEDPDHIFGAFREGCEAYVFKALMAEKLLGEMAKLGLLQTQTLYSIK